MLKVSTTAVWGLLVLALSAGSLQAAEPEITDARLSLLPGDLPGAGYFNITNTSDEPIILVGAESPAFHMTEMHVSTNEDDVARMQAVDTVEIAPGDDFAFAPQGYHLMFMKRTQPLEEGDEVDVLLHFENQPQLSVSFTVVAPGSM